MAPGPRRGSVLVEFAVVALVLYLLLAATIEFGRMMFSAQAAQSAADVAARELAKVPLPPGIDFTTALQRPEVTSRVYDPGYLVIDLSQVPANTNLADFYAQSAPVLNKMLFPLMIVDTERNLMRYPGRVKSGSGTAANPFNPTNLTVDVPILVGGSEDAIAFVDVLEEVSPQAGQPGPFSLVPAGSSDPNPAEMRGMVAVRINYPYQAAALVSYPANGTWPPEPPPDSSALTPNPAIDDDGGIGPNAGALGLGRLEAAGQQVRPYRKVLSTQAFARRELFAP